MKKAELFENKNISKNIDMDFINKEFYYADSLYQEEIKWTFIKGQQLIERIKKNNMYKTNYEVLQKGKYEYLKYYFDVDKYVDEFNEEECNKLLFIMRDNIYNAFKSYLENIEGINNFEPKIIYATSNDKNYKVKEGKFKGKFKYSFRYYINNIITNDILDIKNFVLHYNSNLPEIKIDDLDHSLYSCNQKIRMVNSSKDENYYKRPLIIDENLFKVEDTVISGFYEENSIFLKFKNPKIQNIEDDNNDNNDNTTNETLSVDEEEPKKDNNNTIIELCNLLSKDYFDDYDKWRDLGFIIFNEFEGSSKGFKLFDELSKKSTKYDYDKVFKQYNNNTKKRTKAEKGLKLGTLKHWIKKIHGDDYFIKNIQYSNDEKENKLLDEIIKNKTHNDIAKLFKLLYGNKFKKVGEKQYYYFNDENLWTEDYEGTIIRNFISENLYNKFRPFYDNYINLSLNNDLAEEEKEEYKNKAENITILLKNLKNNVFKNSVLREINDLIKDLDFLDDMNKEKYIIPIKNKKVLNIKTLKVLNRTEIHKFNYFCNVDFINTFDFKNENIKETIEYEVMTYFKQLFVNDEDLIQGFLDIIKTSISGIILKNIFVLVGDGNNGKSLLFKILNLIFSKSMKTLSNDIIIESKNKGSINTEFEKLDQCRIGYISEVSEKDKFNIPLIKKITGDDIIDYRGLYAKNKDLKPTANLFVLTNELPIIANKKKGEIDKAFINRLLVMRLKNNFKVDNTFEQKMIDILDYIFSYIMIKGKIIEKVDLCKSMVEEVKEYVEDNTRNHLEDFINYRYNRIIIKEVEGDDGKIKLEKGWSKKSILREDFIEEWINYCKMKKIYYNNETNNKFQKDLRTYHNIHYEESNHKVYFLGLEKKEIKYDEEEEEEEIIITK